MVGFQTMVIMDLWGMFYHPVVVRARTFVLLLDLISAYCEADKKIMLWALCGRISNYGDNGPLGYGLSCCDGHCFDLHTFV